MSRSFILPGSLRLLLAGAKAVRCGVASSIWASLTTAWFDRLGWQWPHESPFVTRYAATLVTNAIRVRELHINTEAVSILFVLCETWKAKERESVVACALGRQKVSVMRAPMAID